MSEPTALIPNTPFHPLAEMIADTLTRMIRLRTCDCCRWWHPVDEAPRREPGWGACAIHNDLDRDPEAPLSLLALADCGDPPRCDLLTHHDFGCLQWEEG